MRQKSLNLHSGVLHSFIKNKAASVRVDNIPLSERKWSKIYTYTHQKHTKNRWRLPKILQAIVRTPFIEVVSTTVGNAVRNTPWEEKTCFAV